MQQHSIYTTFLNTGSTIHALRTQRGISRAEMYEMTGLHELCLIDYEAGIGPCPEAWLERIEGWLDVSIKLPFQLCDLL